LPCSSQAKISTAIAARSLDERLEAPEACTNDPFRELFPTQNACDHVRLSESQCEQQLQGHRQAFDASLAQGPIFTPLRRKKFGTYTTDKVTGSGHFNTFAQIINIAYGLVQIARSVTLAAGWIARKRRRLSAHDIRYQEERLINSRRTQRSSTGSGYDLAGEEELDARIRRILQQMGFDGPGEDCLGVNSNGECHMSASSARAGSRRAQVDGECSNDETFYECDL